MRFGGEQDRREIEPCRLVHTRGRWNLVGRDVARQDWRTFHADRVRPRVHHLGKTADRCSEAIDTAEHG
ncbi:WYL domain-containing protein [Lentzea sp. NPDC055074]